MKANAPERLYLSKTIYSTYLYQVPDPDDETAVEYIRKDAFIEKACEYLDGFIEILNDRGHQLKKERIIGGLKQAMKDEEVR